MAIPREPEVTFTNEVIDGLRRDYTRAPHMTFAYLLGVLHDATERNTTFRIASKSKAFCILLKGGIKKLGSKAWIYKEGKDRDI